MRNSVCDKQPFSSRGPSKGRPRRELIISLVPNIRPIVEVGCNHGYIADALDAIGTEQRPYQLMNLPRRKVVADGLSCFKKLGTVIIAGIGAYEIARILSEGPQIEYAVLHAPDRPGWLRVWCADNGFKIDKEALAPEAKRFAEVIGVVPGIETHKGFDLEFGPLLGNDPYIKAHIQERLLWWKNSYKKVAEHSATKASLSIKWIHFLEQRLKGLE